MHIRWVGVLCAMLLFSGCATYGVGDRITLAEHIASQHDFSRLDIDADRFDLTAFTGPRKGDGVLHVYIEGDGFAWVTRHRPSTHVRRGTGHPGALPPKSSTP